MTAEAMDRGQRARFIRLERTRIGIPQTEFARRLGVSAGTVRDWEQARVTAPDIAIKYLKEINMLADSWHQTKEIFERQIAYLDQGHLIHPVGRDPEEFTEEWKRKLRDEVENYSRLIESLRNLDPPQAAE